MATASERTMTPYGHGEIDLFAGCRPKELAVIAGLCTEIAVPPGRVLVREGEPGRQFFVVTAGWARVETGSRCLGRVDAGSFFGEIAMIARGACTATVTAMTPMHLMVFGRKEFDALMNLEIRSVMRKMLRTVARRLRVADLEETSSFERSDRGYRRGHVDLDGDPRRQLGSTRDR
ncbi:MAG: Crp/Fnr family transcriptional regulator [Acidimicrobiia bacterium]